MVVAAKITKRKKVEALGSNLFCAANIILQHNGGRQPHQC